MNWVTLIENLAKLAPDAKTMLYVFAAVAGLFFCGQTFFRLAKLGEGSRDENHSLPAIATNFIVGIALLALTQTLAVGDQLYNLPGISHTTSTLPVSMPAEQSKMMGNVFLVLQVLGLLYVIKALFWFRDVPSGQRRAGTCWAVLLAGFALTNAPSIAGPLASFLGAS